MLQNRLFVALASRSSSFVEVLGSDSWKLRWHMRRDEMSWDKVRRAQMRLTVECEERSVKCGAWRVQCEVWSVKCEVWSVKCGVCIGKRAVKCEVWIGKSAVWSEKCEKCEVCSVECEDCSEKWEGRSGASHVTCETGHHFRRVHARTGLAGARRMQVL